MEKQFLHGEYEVTGIAPDGRRLQLTGVVPGNIHTDLLRAGLIPDPFYADHAQNCQWVENWDWIYVKQFSAQDVRGDEALRFEGLDVYGDVYLNGTMLGTTDDMFIPYTFQVGHLLHSGENCLRVYFHSAVRRTAGLPERPAAFTAERLYIRRMQCSFGWDWVNRFVGCGLWRDVTVGSPESPAVEDIYVRTVCLDEEGAELLADVTVVGDAGGLLADCRLIGPDGAECWRRVVPAPGGKIQQRISVVNPALWYPNGYGEQPLYGFRIELRCAGERWDEKQVSFGIRTVRVLQAEDEPGGAYAARAALCRALPHTAGLEAADRSAGFILLVNGKRICCKGANWVPCEPFPGKIPETRYAALLSLARDAGVNMLRVWGGGYMEDAAFYRLCDEWGIMVTQDFLMACGEYPEEDEDFCEQIRKETAHMARTLRNHPSLMWWTGDNEVGASGREEQPDYPGRYVTERVIAPVLRRYDELRPYFPTSPYGGAVNACCTIGTTHNTYFLGDLWNYCRAGDFFDVPNFWRQFPARFIAEAPILGAPALSSLRRFLPEEAIFDAEEDLWRYHTKVNPTPELLEFGFWDCQKALAAGMFGPFTSAQDRLLKLQYLQYEWVRITLEQVRRLKWYSSGILYWMFNDCWPANGWAMVDYYGVPKAGYYAFKQRAKPLIASLDQEDGRLSVWVCNDTLRPRKGFYRLTALDTCTGDSQLLLSGSFQAADNCAQRIVETAISGSGADTVYRCEITCGSEQDVAWYASPAFYRHRRNAPVVTMTRPADNTICVTAKEYVQCVALDGGGVFSDNYFPLMPGEDRLVTFTPREGIPSEILCCGY